MNWYYNILGKIWRKVAASDPNQPPSSSPAGDDPTQDDIRKLIQEMRQEAMRKQIMSQPLGPQVHEHFGVWMYPFAKIKPLNGEGWVIRWFDDPGSIHDINDVSVGDKVCDYANNWTPYWELTLYSH